MTQDLGLAFKNTLWFLVPSGIIFFVIIALNVYWGFDGVSVGGVLMGSYLFLLSPNIPFFIASLALFTFLRKGSSRIVSVIVSNSVAIGSWFLIAYLSQFIMGDIDIGMGGFLLLTIAFLALIIFFTRSITVKYEFIANTVNAGVARPSVGENKFLVYGLVIVIIVAVILIFIFFV